MASFIEKLIELEIAKFQAKQKHFISACQKTETEVKEAVQDSFKEINQSDAQVAKDW